jgi:hypothetical protein
MKCHSMNCVMKATIDTNRLTEYLNQHTRMSEHSKTGFRSAPALLEPEIKAFKVLLAFHDFSINLAYFLSASPSFAWQFTRGSSVKPQISDLT